MSLHWGSRRPDLELAVPIKGLPRHQVEIGRRKKRLERRQAMSFSRVWSSLLILGSQRRRGRGRKQITVNWRRHCRIGVDLVVSIRVVVDGTCGQKKGKDGQLLRLSKRVYLKNVYVPIKGL
jgi:hypothetical protein